MDDFKWDELETDVTPGGTFAPPTARPAGKHAKTERFPCGQCGGSGRYRGVRVHQPATECFACGGKGYFMTSEADRQKARAGRAASKARKLETAVVSFADANPGVARGYGYGRSDGHPYDVREGSP
jgi:DnaJ-class molecular chaperone